MPNKRDTALRALKISRGQIDGILKMIEDERDCIDIANQLLATQSLLKKTELCILQDSLERCLKEASTLSAPAEKLEKLNQILEKIVVK